MTTPASRSEPGAPRQYRYYDLVMAAFVTVLLCANLIGAAKVARLGGFTFGAGVLFFPISYVFGDVLTEVYGYARARKVVWAGFGALVVRVVHELRRARLPARPGLAAPGGVRDGLRRHAAHRARLARRLLLRRVLQLVRAREDEGRHRRAAACGARTIGSTIVGEAVDSAIFYPLAFLGSVGERAGRAR